MEVEKIITTGIGDVNVVSAEILDVNKVPDSKNLFVTNIDAGKFGKKQVITNIQGLEKGQKVLVALEGVKLANGLEIKKTKICNIAAIHHRERKEEK